MTGSMESLDQMLALGSHLRSSGDVLGSTASSIQTADLLNLHADDVSSSSSKTFDPFAIASCSKPVVVTPAPLPPPPSAATSHSHLPAPLTLSKTAFTESFGDSFIPSTQPQLSSTLVLPPPAKSPKVKTAPASSSGISHYSTIRPRKKSGGSDSCGSVADPLPTVKFSISNSNTLKSPSLNRAVPRPGSAANSTSSSPRMVDNFDSPPFAVNFPPVSTTTTATATSEPTRSGPTSALPDRLQDLFTELDPLGTGRSRPYVDKKDFFQDLKKPPAPPLQQPPPPPPQTNLSSQSGGSLGLSSNRRFVLSKQMTMSAVEAMSDSYSREWHQPLAEDPFGSLHFVCPEPESSSSHSATFSSATTDPFDTGSFTIASAGASQFPSSAFFTQSGTSPTYSPPSQYSKVSKHLNSAKTGPSADKMAVSGSPQLRRHPLRVALPPPPPSTVPANQSDSENEMVTLSPPRHTTNGSSSALSWSPRMSPASVRREIDAKDSPVPALVSSTSDDDTSSSEPEACASTGVITAAISPPEPPPRPPVLRPPPLPPKGQPPLLPQRPVLTPTEELYSGGSSGQQTPPLPIPVRKPKHQILSASSSISGGHQVVQRQSSSPSRRVSQEETNTVNSTPALPPPASKPHQPQHQQQQQQQSTSIPAPSSASQLSRISLMQLSSMSLGELAATLQLPPARLASMTLTELALRLAELNQMQEQEEAHEPIAVPSGGKTEKRSAGSKVSAHLHSF